MLRYTTCCLILSLSIFANGYVINQQLPAEYAHSPSGETLVSALAESNDTGAAAIAARQPTIDSVALTQYVDTYQPPLSNSYGHFANFANIGLPKRTVIYTNSVAFTKDAYGRLQFQTPNSVAVSVL